MLVKKVTLLTLFTPPPSLEKSLFFMPNPYRVVLNFTADHMDLVLFQKLRDFACKS